MREAIFNNVFKPFDFYPFGMIMPGRAYNATSSYRFGFNGKEDDNEIEGMGFWQDYGNRMYCPPLSRFPSPDPIAKKYPQLSTYQFASNSPISGVDQDGLEYYYAANGAFFGKIGTSTQIRILEDKDIKAVTGNIVWENGTKTYKKQATNQANQLSYDIGLTAKDLGITNPSSVRFTKQLTSNIHKIIDLQKKVNEIDKNIHELKEEKKAVDEYMKTDQGDPHVGMDLARMLEKAKINTKIESLNKKRDGINVKIEKVKTENKKMSQDSGIKHP